MSFEEPSNKEKQPVSRQEVVTALREKGKDNPEARKILLAWIDEGRSKLDKGEITVSEYNIDWIQLYVDAYLIEEAKYECEQIVDAFEEDDLIRKKDREDARKLYEFCKKTLASFSIN